jgi:LPXTG-site transpeptidase (sortase) family protein
MTIVHEGGPELDAVDVVDEPAVDEEEAETREPRSRWQWQRAFAIAAIVALAAFLVFQLFTGPIERLWYHSRQSQLAADLTTPHKHLGPGNAVGVLQIPRLGTNVVITQGDSPEQLRSGPGHRIATPMPGRRGNVLVMGHRTAWGGPFGDLTKVKVKDYIVVQNKALETYVYRVTAIHEVGGDETALLQSTRDHRLTLVTGRGGRFSDDRLVVTAISGKATKAPGSQGKIRAETPGPSFLFNLTLLAAVLAFALMYGAWRVLRRRTHLGALVVVMVPLGAAGLLAALLWLDLWLPPLH